jgi:hypothetical protein
MSGNVATLDSVETPAARAARHLAEAKEAAFEQIELLVGEMFTVHGIAKEIVEGGPIYPAGVRDLCGRFLEELESKAKTVESVMQKAE